MSLPNVQVLHDRFIDDPRVAVLAVHNEDRGDIGDYIAEHGFTFRFVPNGRTMWQSLDVVRFPTLMVVSPDGRVIFNHTGRMTAEIRDDIEDVARRELVRAAS